MTLQLEPATVARFLVENPEFFDLYADLLSRIKLTSPVGGRTVSLQERQMEVLREKMRTLELRMAELIRMGQENDLITEKFQSWTRSLLLARNDVDLQKDVMSAITIALSIAGNVKRVGIVPVAPEATNTGRQ